MNIVSEHKSTLVYMVASGQLTANQLFNPILSQFINALFIIGLWKDEDDRAARSRLPSEWRHPALKIDTTLKNTATRKRISKHCAW